MKKFYLMPIAALAVLLLGGCGYQADESTLYIEKNKIVSLDIEDFDEERYDKDELTAYVEEMIASCTAEQGEESVKLKKLKVKNGTATLLIEYADTEAYAGLIGEPLFSGTVEEAVEQGYAFDGDFARVDGSELTACGIDELLMSGKTGKYRVVILEEPVAVQVSGKVRYLSTSHTELLDRDQVRISADTVSQDAEDASVYTYIIYK